MRRHLHILTRAEDRLAQAIVEQQRQAQVGHEVVVIDLTAPKPDYERLLDEVFAADSVATW